MGCCPLSQADGLIREVEDEYDQFIRWFEAEAAKDVKSISMDDAYKSVQKAAAFQRLLESKKEQLRIFESSSYYARTMQKFDEVISTLGETKTAFYTIDVSSLNYENNTEGVRYSNYTYIDYFEGVVTEAKQLVSRVNANQHYATGRSLVGILKVLKLKTRPALLESYEDVRLLHQLVVFPLENRANLRDNLRRHQFADVERFLVDAELHLYANPSRPKECLASCRNSVEKFVDDLVARNGVVLVQRFATDLEALAKAKPELIDEATMKLTRGTYDYLSLKGSHVYSVVDQKLLSEADFGLNQTYNIISHLLNRYSKVSSK